MSIAARPNRRRSGPVSSTATPGTGGAGPSRSASCDARGSSSLTRGAYEEGWPSRLRDGDGDAAGAGAEWIDDDRVGPVGEVPAKRIPARTCELGATDLRRT